MYTLMIVEDEPLEQHALRMIVNRQFPYITVLENAKTGREAVEKCREYKPDILLMDIRMPELSGLDAQKEILEFHPDVKTIIVTAYSLFSLAHEAIELRVVDFLLKPVAPETLTKSINKAIGMLESTHTGTAKEQDTAAAIEKALQYIKQNGISRNLSLEEVANQVYLSEAYFSRYFKKKTGVSFTKYVSDMKIKEAKRLLLETDYPIYRIANDLAYSDSAYFAKVFARYTGMQPLKFRKENKKYI